MSPLTVLRLDAREAAPQILGWEVISSSGGTKTGGRIVEVEAYHGEIDPASHAFRGRTSRNQPMFEVAGTIYIYRSYGIHLCLNLVTGPAGSPQALLIRALEPTIGIETMVQRRGQDQLHQLTNGPGKLGQALELNLTMSGSQIGESIQLVSPDEPIDPRRIATGPRIGITKARDQPWRFYLADNPFVSRP